MRIEVKQIMKYLLTITLCSILDGTCVPPHMFPVAYQDLYSCQLAGYQKSVEKITEIGTDNVNKYGIYTRFACRPLETT